MKNPLTQAGIEPATFRFVAQHLNHCATAVPLLRQYTTKISPVLLYIHSGHIMATRFDRKRSSSCQQGTFLRYNKEIL